MAKRWTLGTVMHSIPHENCRHLMQHALGSHRWIHSSLEAEYTTESSKSIDYHLKNDTRA